MLLLLKMCFQDQWKFFQFGHTGPWSLSSNQEQRSSSIVSQRYLNEVAMDGIFTDGGPV